MGEVERKRIHFAGGGTAGHLFPALAIAQEIARRFPDVEVEFWGTKKGIEFRLRDYIAFPLNTISIRGFQRRLTIRNTLVPFQLIMSIIRTILQFSKKRPDLVFGTGSYVSGPVVLAAAALGIPTAIHEQNSRPGMTTRWLGRIARRIYLTYPSSRDSFKHQDRINVFGNPVRDFDRLSRTRKDAKLLNLDPDRKTVFMFGGSQGALRLNMLMKEMVRDLVSPKKIQVIWVTGRLHYEAISKEFGKTRFLTLFDFMQEIHLAYSACDLVICRAGASTIAELTTLGIPAVLIPLPHSAGGHQTANARELESAGAAICLEESEADVTKLRRLIEELLSDPSRLSAMGYKMKQMGRPNAAHDIVSDLFDTLLVD